MSTLSSENLYHFKANPEIIKSILKNGLRHNLWSERLPYKESDQQNFVICFCDIKMQDAEFHREVFGNNALVFTKDWGKAKGVSPVRYIHENSPGIFQSYIQSKNRLREIRQKTSDDLDTIVHDYSIFSVLFKDGKLTQDSIEDDIEHNPSLAYDLENLEQELSEVYQDLSQTNNKKLAKYFRSLMARILDLHNELERRDAFMRVYKEDFTHPATNKTIKDKVLYDEKEWRSIKFPEKEDYEQAIEDGYLPHKYNLTFQDQDLLAILCKNDQVIHDLQNYIDENEILVGKKETKNKLKLIDSFKD